MSYDQQGKKVDRRGGIDPAALAVASLAAAVSVMTPPGPYAPGSMMLGLTILLVVFGYDVDPDRTPRQRLAFSTVCALISLLVLGYPLEILWSSSKMTRLSVMFGELPNDINYSEVPPGFFLLVWLILIAAFFAVDRHRSDKNKNSNRSKDQS